MAKRRMMLLKITESDDFCKMSYQAQALYLHLNQNADDEGVINNSLQILSTLKLKRKNLDELLEKKFILEIKDKNIFVIKHWYLANIIQKDRFEVSTYHEDIIKYLELGKDKVYRYKNG